jgi:hypothetical protein
MAARDSSSIASGSSPARSSSAPGASRRKVAAAALRARLGAAREPLAVGPERAVKGVHRGEQALAQGVEREQGVQVLLARDRGGGGLAQRAVRVEPLGEREVGVVGREVAQRHLHHLALGKLHPHAAQLALEPAHHHLLAERGLDPDPAEEARRVEQLQEGGEARAVPVVRRGREKQAVFEERRELAHRAGEGRVGRGAGAARGGGVVGLVEHEHRALGLVAQEVAQGGGVVRVAQERVRDDEARVRAPGVELPPALAAARAEPLAVDDDEGEPEARVELVAPLGEHRRGRGHHHAAHALAQHELADDERGLDGLAEAHVVGDEEPHAGLFERAQEGLELVALDRDARAKGRLHAAGVGDAEGVPADAVVEGREAGGRIEARDGERRRLARGEHARVGLGLPEHVRALARAVVVDAREPDEVTFTRDALARGRDGLDHVPSRPHAHHHAHLGKLVCAHRVVRSFTARGPPCRRV